MRVLLSALLLLLFVPGWSGEPRTPRFRSGATLTLTPLDLPGGARDGRLVFLKGWELSSDDPAFGGFSAIAVQDGRFTLLSDFGTTLRFTFREGESVRDVRFGALPDGPGSGWRKEHRDAESLTIDTRHGLAWVGFEPSDRLNGSIWRYDLNLTRAEAGSAPPAMRRWPENGGAESLVRLRSGRFVAISEDARLPRTRQYRALLFAGDPAVANRRGFAFSYRPPIRGSRPTDAAELPNGDLIVLNRRFTLRGWFEGSVALIRRDDIRPGKNAQGALLGRIGPPLPNDNYEGIAVTREGRDTILWIVSDDNESHLQRSLLLKFRLD